MRTRDRRADWRRRVRRAVYDSLRYLTDDQLEAFSIVVFRQERANGHDRPVVLSGFSVRG